MVLSDRTSRGIEACYDAVLAPDCWSTALQLLGESLGAESCTFETSNGKVIHALESRHPKIRYGVTVPTHLFGALKRLLPDGWMDRMLSSVGGDGSK